jgi:hypothetical protein
VGVGVGVWGGYTPMQTCRCMPLLPSTHERATQSSPPSSFVPADGGLHLATPIDVLLVLLPLLDRCRGEGTFCDAEQLLSLCGFDAVVALLAPLVTPHLPCVCEVKEAGGQLYYRFSEPHALAWLRCKVDQAKTALKAHGAPTRVRLSGSVHLRFVRFARF